MIEIYGFIPTASTVNTMPRRYMLSKKERRKLVEEIGRVFPGLAISRRSRVEVFEDKGIGRIYIIDDVPALISPPSGGLIPHLKYLLSKGYYWLPYVVVDMGAVKPLLRGADLMVPGIRRVHGVFNIGDIVVVVDEKYGKPFMVGRALVSSDKIVSGEVSRGRALENLHRVGDRYWRVV